MAAFAVPLALSGISALAGLFGGKPKQTTTTTNSNNTSNSSNSGYSDSTPQLSDLQQLLSNVGGYGAINKLRTGSDGLIDSIKTQGLQAINQGSDIQKRMTDNILSSRGLQYSPYAAGALAAPESQRISQQSQLFEQLPQLKENLDNQNLTNVLNQFKALPTATSSNYGGSQQSNSSGTQTSTGTTPDQSVPGFLSGLGSSLAAPNAGGSNLASILKSLGLG